MITFMLNSTSLVTKQPLIKYIVLSTSSDAAPIAVENTYFQEFYDLNTVSNIDILIVNILCMPTGLLGGK